MVSGEHVVIGRAVIRIWIRERPNQRKFIELLRQPWQVFAHLNTRDIGTDRLKLAAEFEGGGGLHVPRINC